MTNIKDFWTREKTLELIQSYKDARCLWIITGNTTEDRQERNDAMDNIAKTVGCETTAVDKKIKSLLSQYRRENIKMIQKIKEGYEPEEIQKTSWFGLKLLQFLDQKTKRSGNRLSTEDNIARKEKSIKNYTTNFVKVEVNNDLVNEDDDGDDEVEEEEEEEMYLVKENALANTNINQGQKRQIDQLDECTVFGELLAIKLRKLDPITRLEMQHKIDNLIYEAEKALLKKNLRR